MNKNGRQTIGNELMEQLDDSPISLLTSPIPKSEPIVKDKKAKTNKKKDAALTVAEKPISQTKERMTVQINKNTIERVKDCVYWNRLTVAQFVEEALEAALELAEKENGKPFVKRRSELKPGRPTK